MKIGFIGAGPVATHLGDRFVRAGHDVRRGHRDGPEDFANAVDGADVVVIAIPYRVCARTLPDFARSLAGRIVIDATNPLAADHTPLALPQSTSAAEEIAALLPESRIVKAFNTIFADALAAEDDATPLAAFIAGNDREANEVVARLASEVRYTPLVVDTIVAARYLESLAHLNIALAFGSGIGTQGGFAYVRR